MREMLSGGRPQAIVRWRLAGYSSASIDDVSLILPFRAILFAVSILKQFAFEQRLPGERSVEAVKGQAHGHDKDK